MIKDNGRLRGARCLPYGLWGYGSESPGIDVVESVRVRAHHPSVSSGCGEVCAESERGHGIGDGGYGYVVHVVKIECDIGRGADDDTFSGCVGRSKTAEVAFEDGASSGSGGCVGRESVRGDETVDGLLEEEDVGEMIEDHVSVGYTVDEGLYPYAALFGACVDILDYLGVDEDFGSGDVCSVHPRPPFLSREYTPASVTEPQIAAKISAPRAVAITVAAAAAAEMELITADALIREGAAVRLWNEIVWLIAIMFWRYSDRKRAVASLFAKT